MARVLDRDEDIQEALRGVERKSAIYEWMRQRSAAIKESVSAHDILRQFGITLRYPGSSNEEQFSCPFHGKDRKPSARVYPDNGRSSSHVWCFTCQKNWDVFGLWRNFMGHGDEIKFGQILFELERQFGIVPPEAPELVDPKNRGPTEAEQDVDKLFEVCERRLTEAKPKYEFEKYLRTGQLLDRLHFRWESRTITVEDVDKVLRQILDKIGERIRA